MENLGVSGQSERCPDIARIQGGEEREVVLNGVTWKYWHAGSGPTLLLIHGFMGYSFSWRFNVEPLARYFSIYAIDLPGCGFSMRSDVLPGSLAGDAEAMLSFMEHLGIEQANVLGTSRGGGVAIALTALAAQRGRSECIRRVILNAPINPWSKNGLFLTRLLATAIGGMYVVHLAPRMPFMLNRYFKGLYGDPKRIVAGSMEGYKAGLQPMGSFEHLLRIVRSWHGDLKYVEDSLPLIGDVPTLLLWGELDSAVYLESAYELQRRLKNSAVEVMDGIGHLPYEEAPDDFNRIVCDFFLRNEPPTALEKASMVQQVVERS
jgi:pimeloyl-ACP methyl ester carboxylesterase